MIIRVAALQWFISSTVFSYAQDVKVTNLVFEGAGMRGLAYAGVIQELEERDLLKDIKKVGGTSAGAITAMMLSLGYSSEEINRVLSNTEFEAFNDGAISGVSRMKKNFGWFLGDKFNEWVRRLIEEKTGDPDITFGMLSDGFIPLYVTTTCLNKQKLLVLSAETYPNMKVCDAVRASMSIPLYFKAVFIDSVGNVYQNYQDAKDLDILVDGGIIGNYPIYLFDSLDTTEEGVKVRIANRNTLGFRIDSEEQIHEDRQSNDLIVQEIQDFTDYVTALYTFTMESLNRNTLTTDDWDRTVSVSSEGIGPRIKKLSSEDKEKLIKSGREYTKRYFESKY